MSPKRFVAGAVCPRCSAQDRVRAWRDAVREYRDCIDCGYQDSMRLDGAPEPELPATRVSPRSQPDESAEADTAVQVLNFVPNPARKAGGSRSSKGSLAGLPKQSRN